MFQPTLVLQGPFFDQTLSLVQQLSMPATTACIITAHPHNVTVIREQMAKLLLGLGVPFEYDNADIVLPNGSRFMFQLSEPGTLPPVVLA